MKPKVLRRHRCSGGVQVSTYTMSSYWNAKGISYSTSFLRESRIFFFLQIEDL
ncbi:hypothetical protein HanPI659440_Chr00c04g0711751 [Helianthus annuus]|uniref:Uncharacterized protein n=1 Tax=Helianthus annuus TaxID=4232 RepID=A0A9K3NHC5_HELAN|nr:hypothetical protein HanXRQr2_Chr07g0308911 [Helianthus annuus]KAJ0817980.1 hypothetical protein HanPI659440_Chr00c04g0711751 [Helianthus annuus]